MTGTTGTRDRRAAHDARRARRAAVTDPAVALEAAAQFLAVRSRSVAETRRRLLHLGYSPELAQEAIERLGRMGYLDDLAFARAWMESRDRSRPRGETALRGELLRKGVEDAVIRVALAERAAGRGHPALGGPQADGVSDEGIDPDARPGSVDRDAAQRLLARRSASLGREPDPRKRRQQAYGLLARSGFDPGSCRDGSLTILGGPTAEDEGPVGEGDAG